MGHGGRLWRLWAWMQGHKAVRASVVGGAYGAHKVLKRQDPNVRHSVRVAVAASPDAGIGTKSPPAAGVRRGGPPAAGQALPLLQLVLTYKTSA